VLLAPSRIFVQQHHQINLRLYTKEILRFGYEYKDVTLFKMYFLSSDLNNVTINTLKMLIWKLCMFFTFLELDYF